MGIPRKNQFPSHPYRRKKQKPDRKRQYLSGTQSYHWYFSHLPGYCFRTLPRHVSQSKSEIGRNQSPAGYTKTENTAARSFLWTSDLMRHPVWRLETSTCQRQTALGIDSPHHRSFWDTRSFRTISFKSKRIRKQMDTMGRATTRLSFWIPSMDRTNQLLPVTISRSKGKEN